LFSRRAFIAAGLLAPLARPAAAEARYPAHSVTVVNPFAAGGQSDPIGRIVNAHFQNALGQPLQYACSTSRRFSCAIVSCYDV
jgi:tripartite-type tricarboxylate transporter receptor subunit TctC